MYRLLKMFKIKKTRKLLLFCVRLILSEDPSESLKKRQCFVCLRSFKNHPALFERINQLEAFAAAKSCLILYSRQQLQQLWK